MLRAVTNAFRLRPTFSLSAGSASARSYHQNIVEHYENPRNVGENIFPLFYGIETSKNN